MKKTKIIVPALGMLLLSTAASVTGTVAWFAANASVSVTNMQVKAKAEGGVAIAAYSYTATSVSDSASHGYNDTLTNAVFTAPLSTAYTDTATYSQASAAELLPTSTADTTAWYHANSNSENNYAASGVYQTLAAANLKADGLFVSGDGTAAGTQYKIDAQYFLYQKFSVKATGAGTLSLWVSAITVNGEQNSAALNDSLRIAVKHGTESVAFFAPMYDSSDDTTLYFYNGTARTAGSPVKGLAPNTQIANNSVTTAATDIQIWVYYEGEDENCKTINASDVDTLTISMTFSSVAPQA